jgi:hypothetical protein
LNSELVGFYHTIEAQVNLNLLERVMEWLTVFTGLAAFGTIAVAIMAIWGEWVRTTFVGPKLQLAKHNFRGKVGEVNVIDPVQNQVYKKKTVFYHLCVQNSRPWFPGKNCRVMLRQLHRRGPDGTFYPVNLVVPRQYMWAPSEWSPALQTVTDSEILDFGRIVSGTGKFEPMLYTFGSDFDGFVKANEAVRYSLQVIADNAKPSLLQIFEVAWNGEWSENLDRMEQNLKIREVHTGELRNEGRA